MRHLQRSPAAAFLGDSAQRAMIVVGHGDKAKRLGSAFADRGQRAEHLRQALYPARLRMKRNFDEIALAQGLGEMQQAAVQ